MFGSVKGKRSPPDCRYNLINTYGTYNLYMIYELPYYVKFFLNAMFIMKNH